MADPKNTKKVLKEQREASSLDIRPPRIDIDFQVDTLGVGDGAAAYFSPNNNTVTVNYIEGGDNSFNESLPTKAHEQKHRDNHNAGMENMPMNLEQYYNVCIHNEISANMAELLQLREQYKNAKTEKDKQAIKESEIGKKFGYYLDAVDKGEINPFATNSAELEKEMKFIAVETQKMWMNDYSKWYDKNHVSMTKIWFSEHDYDELKSNPENYEKARKIAYNIGGIDFTQYMDDIQCINPRVKKADQMIAENKPRDEIKENISTEPLGDQALVSVEQHVKLNNIEKISQYLNELKAVRDKWFTCKNQDEKDKLLQEATDAVSWQWLLAANSGEIKNMGSGAIFSDDEVKIIAPVVTNLSSTYTRTSGDDIEKYIKIQGEVNIKEAVQSGEADKNYKNEASRLLSVGGTDFSKYLADPLIGNYHVIDIDKKLRKGQKLDAQSDFKDFNWNKELVVPEFKPIDGLSMEQQLEVYKHQMFMANVKARLPFLNRVAYDKVDPLSPQAQQMESVDWSDKENPMGKQMGRTAARQQALEAFDREYADELQYVQKPKNNDFTKSPWKDVDKSAYENSSLSFNSFYENLENNPELKDKWAKAMKEAEQKIAQANKGDLILTDGDSKAYQKEIDKIYTINGINLKNIYEQNPQTTVKIDDMVPKIKTPEIQKVKESSWTDRAKNKAKSGYEAVKQAMPWNNDDSSDQKDAKKPKTSPKDYRKKERKANYYTGEPQYRQWSPEERVSPVQTVTIGDFSAPYLKQQMEALKQREAEEAEKKAKLALAQQKANQQQKKFDDKVNNKASQQQKTTPTQQKPKNNSKNQGVTR